MTNEERLELENKQLRASIEIYSQQCMELAKFSRGFEQLSNQVPELQSDLNAVSARLYFVENTLEKLGEFLSIRSKEKNKFSV